MDFIKDNKDKKKYIRIIGLVLFFYIISKIDLRELLSILKNIDSSYLLPAIFLLPSLPVLRTLKWKILVDSQDTKISFKKLMTVFLKGLFLGTITPGKLGEFWRAKYLTEIADISGGRAFYTALTDRLTEIIIIIAIGLIGVVNLFIFNKIKMGWSIIVLLLILTILIIYFFIERKRVKKILSFLLKIFLPSSIREKTNSFFDEFYKGIENLNLILFLKLLGLEFSIYLVAIFIYYLLAQSLGIAITFFQLFLIVALVWLILTLPITILGLGTREAGYIFFFNFFNIAPSSAVAFSITVLFVVGILLSIPGAIMFLKK